MTPDSRRRAGIILTVLGTVLLAFALTIRTTRAADGTAVHQFGTVAPTEAKFRKGMLWGGLTLIAVGSALQW